MSEKKENDLLKKPSTVDNSDKILQKIEDIDIQEFVLKLNKEELDSIISELSGLEPKTRLVLENLISNIRNDLELKETNNKFTKKLNNKKSKKSKGSCILM